MMKAYWQVTRAQLILFSRNRQVLFWSLVFPIFLMIMLGSFIGGDKKMGLNLSIQDQDHSIASKMLVQQLSQQQGIMVTEVSSIDDDKKRIQNGESRMVLVIPPSYGETLGKAVEASSKGEISANKVTELKLYLDKTNMAIAVPGMSAMNTIVGELNAQALKWKPAITVAGIALQAPDLRYIDFLVPGIVAMMIMSNNMNGVAGQIASWRERGILRRLQSTPLTSGTFIAGQITARLMLNSFQALIVLVVGFLVFGTAVKGSWLLLIAFVIMGTLAFMSIGFIIAGLAKTPESAGPIAGFVSFPLLFLGGVFFPIQNMPEWLQPVVKALPIAHLSTAIRQVMNVGADLGTLWTEAALLGGWLVGAFIIASYTFKWE